MPIIIICADRIGEMNGGKQRGWLNWLNYGEVLALMRMDLQIFIS